MKPVSLMTRPANEGKKENWHMVPCKHKYCGPAKVKEYFEDLIEPFPQQGAIVPEAGAANTAENNQVVSYLYGNLLVGRKATNDLRGFLIKVTEAKTGRIYERISTSEQTTIWGKDVPIVKDEDFLLGLDTYTSMADIMASV